MAANSKITWLGIPGDYNQFSFDRITSNPFLKIFKAGHNEKVIVDASAGLGRDSYLIYQLGHSVHSIEEKSNTFWAHARRKINISDTQFWQLHAGNCTHIIPKLEQIDIIFWPNVWTPQKSQSSKYTHIQHFCKPEYANSAETIDFLMTYAEKITQVNYKITIEALIFDHSKLHPESQR